MKTRKWTSLRDGSDISDLKPKIQINKLWPRFGYRWMFFTLYCSILGFGTWNVFVCIFEDVFKLQVWDFIFSDVNACQKQMLYMAIWQHGHMDHANQPANHPVVYDPAAGTLCFLKNMPLDASSMYFVKCVDVCQF